MQTMKTNPLAHVILLVGLLLLTFTNLLAQASAAQSNPSPTPTGDSTPDQPSPSPTPESKPKVISVVGNVQLDDIVEVDVQDLEKGPRRTIPNLFHT